MKKNKVTRLGLGTWITLLVFGLIGQIAWMVENMYFNVFLYNTITGDTGMIAAMVAASSVVATVTTLLMGALSDKLGKRKGLMVGGYLLWGLSVMAFAFVSVSGLEQFMGAAAAVQTDDSLAEVLAKIKKLVKDYLDREEEERRRREEEERRRRLEAERQSAIAQARTAIQNKKAEAER